MVSDPYKQLAGTMTPDAVPPALSQDAVDG